MSRTSLLCTALTLGTLIGGPGQAKAQQPYANSSTYRPQRSPLSPYLQLFRTDPGQILPSYHNFVRPRAEARVYRRQQERNVQRLQRGLNQVQQQSLQLQYGGGRIQSGIGSGFQTNRQHFGGHRSFFGTHRTQAPAGAARRGR